MTSDEGVLSDRLVDELQRRILSGSIPVGSWLRHSMIADEFGVSRTPVREALRVLNARGIVSIVKNRGARVNGLSSRDIRELGEIRGELEGLAASLAVHRIDDEQLAQMQDAVRDFEEAIEGYVADPARSRSEEANIRWSEANEAFHGAILRASGNRQLLVSIEDISRRLPRNSSYAVYSGNSRLLRRNADEHRVVLDAILARDEKKARTAMVKHIRSASDALARWVEDQERSSQVD
ncbi:GntR family transcriptional regulator [Streptomyces parvulus]|uniref:GntR family transcriptional regulator n=1 Tax=Streptomyces parvulus TaxID=146923 RepID=A0A369UTE0_9ACTN|nr:GntR family transcriptional regulator [Streptomyces parvulus]RDD84022.1 GntR family transcriptional regulator [Streptomyces parvulus]